MSNLDTLENIDSFVGNWTRWSDYSSGFRDNDRDYKNYGILYLASRDSEFGVEIAYNAIIKRLLKADSRRSHWFEYSASHWAVGYVYGVAIKPYTKNGKLSAAYETVKYALETLQYEDYLPESEIAYWNKESELWLDLVKDHIHYDLKVEVTTDQVTAIHYWCVENHDSDYHEYSYHNEFYIDETTSETIKNALYALEIITRCPICGNDREDSSEPYCYTCTDSEDSETKKAIATYEYNQTLNYPDHYDHKLL